MNCHVSIECDQFNSYQLTMETFEVEGCVRGHHVSIQCRAPPSESGDWISALWRLCARAQSLATSFTLSLAACSSFPEREEFPMSREYTSAESFLKYWYSATRTHVLMCARKAEWPAGWGGV